MTLPAYKKALTMGEKALNAVLATPRNASAKKKAELEMCKLDEKVATLETELHEECTKKDLDFFAIIQKQDKIALTKRQIKQFQVILDEMFPDE